MNVKTIVLGTRNASPVIGRVVVVVGAFSVFGDDTVNLLTVKLLVYGSESKYEEWCCIGKVPAVYDV